MPHLALFLFGPPRIELDGRPVKINRHKATALLTYLVVSGKTHSRNTLAALLWPDTPERLETQRFHPINCGVKRIFFRLLRRRAKQPWTTSAGTASMSC